MQAVETEKPETKKSVEKSKQSFNTFCMEKENLQNYLFSEKELLSCTGKL